MGEPKGIARAAKERRRAEAETRNARTPDHRRRVAREGSVKDRSRKRPAVARGLHEVSFWVNEDGTRGFECLCGCMYDGIERADLDRIRTNHVCWTPPARSTWRPAKKGDTPGQLPPQLPPPARRPAPREPGSPVTPKAKRVPRPRRRPTTTRASHVAPRRIGDGLKPNHGARAIAIADVFGGKVEQRVPRLVDGQRDGR